MNSTRYEQELMDIILANNWFMEVLKTVRDRNPTNWFVGGEL